MMIALLLCNHDLLKFGNRRVPQVQVEKGVVVITAAVVTEVGYMQILLYEY